MTRTVFTPGIEDLLPFSGKTENLTWMPEYLEESIGWQQVDFSHEAISGKLKSIGLLDYHFQSGEIACAQLITFEDRQMAVAQKYGDRSSWILKVLDREVWRDFRHAVLDAQLDDDRIDVVPLQGCAVVREQSYLRFTKDDGDALSVHMLHPRWGNFEHLFKTHEAHLDGEPVEYVSWTHPDRKSWERDDAELVKIRVTSSGETRDVPGVAIGFRRPVAADPLITNDPRPSTEL